MQPSPNPRKRREMAIGPERTKAFIAWYKANNRLFKWKDARAWLIGPLCYSGSLLTEIQEFKSLSFRHFFDPGIGGAVPSGGRSPRSTWS